MNRTNDKPHLSTIGKSISMKDRKAAAKARKAAAKARKAAAERRKNLSRLGPIDAIISYKDGLSNIEAKTDLGRRFASFVDGMGKSIPMHHDPYWGYDDCQNCTLDLGFMSYNGESLLVCAELVCNDSSAGWNKVWGALKTDEGSFRTSCWGVQLEVQLEERDTSEPYEECLLLEEAMKRADPDCEFYLTKEVFENYNPEKGYYEKNLQTQEWVQDA